MRVTSPWHDLFMAALSDVQRAIELLRAVTVSAPPAQVCGPDARAMVEALCRAEKVAAGARALYAARVAATGAFEDSGQTSAARWLAQVSGEPVGRAQGALSAAGALDEAPLVRDALLAGDISLDQAKVAAPASAADPGAEAGLLQAAKGGSFAELVDLAQRTVRAKESEAAARAREARVHARRYCRTWAPPEGGLRIEALLCAVDGARLKAAVDQMTAVVFDEARAAGVREPTERYRADALVRLATAAGTATGTGTATATATGRPKARGARVLLRVDAAALRRGALEGGEVCEIPGVGPVSVATAKDLLGDAVCNVVVHDGVDVLAVSRTTRARTFAQEIALMERDPHCVVPGCAVSAPLQVDHWRTDYALGGRTELENLCRLCVEHHAMKTHRGWRLEGGPGRWRWVGPRSRTETAPEATPSEATPETAPSEATPETAPEATPVLGDPPAEGSRPRGEEAAGVTGATGRRGPPARSLFG